MDLRHFKGRIPICHLDSIREPCRIANQYKPSRTSPNGTSGTIEVSPSMDYQTLSVTREGAAAVVIEYQCTASIGIGKATFKIDSIKPDNLQISAVIPLELDNTPIDATQLPWSPPTKTPGMEVVRGDNLSVLQKPKSFSFISRREANSAIEAGGSIPTESTTRSKSLY